MRCVDHAMTAHPASRANGDKSVSEVNAPKIPPRLSAAPNKIPVRKAVARAGRAPPAFRAGSGAASSVSELAGVTNRAYSIVDQATSVAYPSVRRENFYSIARRFARAIASPVANQSCADARCTSGCSLGGTCRRINEVN